MSTNVHKAIPKIKVANALGVAIIIFQNCRAGIIFQFEVECLPDHVGPGVIWASLNWIMYVPLHDWSQGYLAEESHYQSYMPAATDTSVMQQGSYLQQNAMQHMLH